ALFLESPARGRRYFLWFYNLWFYKEQKGIRMIQLDYRNIGAGQVGAENGLEVQAEFSAAAESLRGIVSRLYENKDRPGAWTR
ncbi:hypothetical protein, partial [Streptomyces galilaeus]|uniref:hypothetical protein n=1 Tax=Streptomyces galilaeus TaxID=33899 RepID=UPI0038F60D93